MFPLELPIAVQDGIVAFLFVAAAFFLIYRKLKKKTKPCPACDGGCVPAAKSPTTSSIAKS